MPGPQTLLAANKCTASYELASPEWLPPWVYFVRSTPFLHNLAFVFGGKVQDIIFRQLPNEIPT